LLILIFVIEGFSSKIFKKFKNLWL
jgi:hypothetical protein